MNVDTLIATIANAKAAIKTGAVDARAAAPKGEKMAHGQHYAATKTAEMANHTLALLPKLGFTPAAVSAKVSKTGRKEFTVTYRESQTLAQRVDTMKNAAARRKEKRDAAKAAIDAAAAAKTAAMPSAGADAIAALAKIAA
jgi:hypothetical protein